MICNSRGITDGVLLVRGGREQREAEQQPRGGGGGGQHVVPAADSAPLSSGWWRPDAGRGQNTGSATATRLLVGDMLFKGRMKFLGQCYQMHLYTHGAWDTRHNMYTFCMQSWTRILSDCLLE